MYTGSILFVFLSQHLSPFPSSHWAVYPAHQPNDKLQCYSSRRIPPLQPAAIRNGGSPCLLSYSGIKASILPPGCLNLLSVTKGFASAGKIPPNLVILKYLGGGEGSTPSSNHGLSQNTCYPLGIWTHFLERGIPYHWGNCQKCGSGKKVGNPDITKLAWCKKRGYQECHSLAKTVYQIRSDQISCSVVSDSSRPHESQHTRPPCPSPTPRVHSDSRPSSQWCHPAISSSVVPFSSCPQSLPASESFPMSQLFA